MLPSLPAYLESLLAPFCAMQSGPGSGPFYAVSLEGTRVLAAQRGISLAEAMAVCLEHGIWPLRFARNRGVFSAAEQGKLLTSRAAVIGCGGLGGHVAALLARAGVGALTLCDPDTFDESNLNRQLFCTEQNLGQNKAQAAHDALLALASHTRITVLPVAACPETLPEILSGADIAMDCLDSLTARRHLAAAATEAGIPMVYATVAGDEGFAMLALPGDANVRRLCAAGDTAPKAGAQTDTQTDANAGTNTGAVTSANTGAETTLGVPTLTPAATAAIQTVLAIHSLLGKRTESSLLHHLDLAVPQLEALEF